MSKPRFTYGMHWRPRDSLFQAVGKQRLIVEDSLLVELMSDSQTGKITFTCERLRPLKEVSEIVGIDVDLLLEFVMEDHFEIHYSHEFQSWTAALSEVSRVPGDFWHACEEEMDDRRRDAAKSGVTTGDPSSCSGPGREDGE